MKTLEETAARLRNESDEANRTELDRLGYVGVDEMDTDDVFDTLLEYYSQYPEDND